jgi:hypothetical protein
MIGNNQAKGKLMKRTITAALLVALLASATMADVKPHALFSDGIVLQQGVPIPVWGTANVGEKVTVRLAGQEASATVGKDGKWLVRLPPREAGGPFVMTISGDNTLTIGNVMVGEVWVCAGQSNMAFSLGGADTATNEIPKANYPKLRLFGVGAKGYALPQTTLPGGKWVECSPQTAGGFTAVGYFFGRDLLKARSVAVGLISTAWSGTCAEAWTSLDGLKKAKELQGYADVAQKLADEYPRAMYLLPGRFAKYWADFTRWNNFHGKAYEKAYAAWIVAAEAAKAGGAGFIDLNAIIADHYDAEGQEKVASTYFGKTDATHTIKAGAQFNARCVVKGLRKLPACPLNNYLAAP